MGEWVGVGCVCGCVCVCVGVWVCVVHVGGCVGVGVGVLVVSGALFLVYTAEVPDFILNAVALGFVLDMDEVIFLLLWCLVRAVIRRTVSLLMRYQLRRFRVGALVLAIFPALRRELVGDRGGYTSTGCAGPHLWRRQKFHFHN